MIEHGQLSYSEKAYEWTVISEASEEEILQFCMNQAITMDVYSISREADISYFNTVTTDPHQPLRVLHLPVRRKESYGKMQSAESTATFIYSNDRLICVLNGLDKEWIISHLESGKIPHQVMLETIKLLYNDIEERLKHVEVNIEHLMSEAKEKANREVLLTLTDLEQELVFFSKRIDDYDDTISEWLNDDIAIKNTSDSERDMIHLRIKKSQFNSHLYKELIESTSGLLSDSIDNKLNSIMEFLESLTLVISIPTLIFSLFGMNTGGLIGRHSPTGTLVVILVSIILGAIMAVYLKKREYL